MYDCSSIPSHCFYRRVSIVFVLLCCLACNIYGQRFHFGGNVSALASQVDGDNLRGFNKYGFSAGLLSGYSLNPSHWLVVELQYASFGSRQSKEESTTRLETEIQTLSIFCGYTLRFGDAWDGSKKFRVLIGPRIHSIQKAHLGTNADRTLLDRYFVATHLSFGVLLSESVLLDLGYHQGLTNILKTEYQSIDKLRPYYLSLGVVYYLYK